MKAYLYCMLYVLLTGTACWGRSLSLEFDKKDFHIDSSLKIIVCAQKPLETLGIYDTVYAVLGSKMLFKDIPESLLPDTSYILIDTLGGQYELFFTQLPLISIVSDSGIVDHKVLGSVLIHDTSSLRIQSFIGMEMRGGSSRFWPKKKFDIEFWIDSLGQNVWEPPLFGMRSDKDWILEAMYNEPMRIRSYTNWQIWRKAHTLYYTNLEKDAKSYVRGRYVELFLNGHYQGVYALTEKIDRKQLKLKKFTTEFTEGELYKAFTWGEACQYISVPDYDNGYGTWGGYEFKYPNELRLINWGKLHQFTDFVVNSSQGDFRDRIDEQFHIPNAVDYFLFLNLLTAYDNTGKNLFTAKYDKSSPYFYVPWDLDGTWGMFWDGSLHQDTDKVITNNLYDRMLSVPGLHFRAQLEERWLHLRNSCWHSDSLEAMFQSNRNILLKNNIYRRERLAWPTFSYDNSQFVYLQDHMKKRLTFLDEYFKYGHQVDPSSVKDESDFKQSLGPNPAFSEFTICQYKPFAGATVYVIDVSGKVVQSVQLVESCGTVDISGLRAGVYIVRSGGQIHKLLVQKEP